MGTFLVKSRDWEVSNTIRLWLTKKGLLEPCDNRQDDNDDETEKTRRGMAVKGSLWNGIKVLWESKPINQTECVACCSVCLPSKLVLISVVYMLVVCGIILVAVPPLFALHTTEISARSGILPYFAFGACLSGYIAYWWHRTTSARLTNFENALWKHVSEKHLIETIDAISPKLMPGWLGQLVFTLLILTCLVVTMRIGRVFTILFAAASGDYILRLIWRMTTRSRFYKWKIRLLNYTELWTNCFLSVVFLFLLGIFINQIGFSFSQFIQRKPNSPRGMFQVSLAEESFKRKSLDIEAENWVMFRTPFPKGDRGDFTAKALALCIWVFIVLDLMANLYVVLRSFLRGPREWEKTAFMDSSLGMASPLYGAEVGRNRLSNVVLVSHFLYSFCVHLCGFVLSIDALSYCLLKTGSFLRESGVPISWFFTLAKAALGSTTGEVLSVVLVSSSCFPVFLYACCMLIRILRLRGLRLRLHPSMFSEKETQTKVESVLASMRTLCNRYGVTSSFYYTERSQILVFVKGRFLGKGGSIYISEGALGELNREELIAVMAHEVGHLVNGAWRMRWLCLLSILGLFPNYYLTLLLDSHGVENDADKFALSNIDDPESLVNAILKTSAFNWKFLLSLERSSLDAKVTRRSPRFWNSLLRPIMVSARFFFDDMVLGYSHPPVSERIRYIRGALS
jgi:hypothetical protein